MHHRAWFVLSLLSAAMCSGACAPSSEDPGLDLLRAGDWKFAYLGNSRNYPADSPTLRSIRLPGRWHERLPGTPRTGVAYLRLDFTLNRDQRTRLRMLVLGPLESAAEVRLNGRVIGRVGRPGVNRRGEFARIHPEFIELDPGLPRPTNRLELLISNYHTRGGALLRLRLMEPSRARTEFARRMLREGLLLGMLTVAGIFFFIIWLTDRRDRAHLFAALLMLLIIIRGASSNALLEFLWPERNWTDLRLLMETWTGVSMTPAVLFWLIHSLFPILRERPLPGSRHGELARIYFTFFSGVYLNTGALLLSTWFLVSLDASVYVAHLQIMLRLFIVPSLFLYLALLIIAAIHRQPGALLILAGFLVFMAAAFSDVRTIITASAAPLRASMGMLVFVLCMSIVLGRRIHGLHRLVLRGRDSLRENNRDLRAMERIKDRFLLNSTRLLTSPLNEIVETVLRLLDKPGPDMGPAQLNLLTRLADRGRESLRRFARMEYYLTRGSNGSARRTPLWPAEFLGSEIIALEKSRGVTLKLDASADPAPVLAHGDSLRMLMSELCEFAVRLEASCDIALRNHGEICLLSMRLRYPTPSRPHEQNREPEMGLGLPLMERVAEIHGGRLKTTRGESADISWMEWSFPLEYAERSSHANPELEEKIRHARFLAGAGFLKQSAREFHELGKLGALRNTSRGD